MKRLIATALIALSPAALADPVSWGQITFAVPVVGNLEGFAPIVGPTNRKEYPGVPVEPGLGRDGDPWWTVFLRRDTGVQQGQGPGSDGVARPAEVYRCPTPEGPVEYSDRPCPSGAPVLLGGRPYARWQDAEAYRLAVTAEEIADRVRNGDEWRRWAEQVRMARKARDAATPARAVEKDSEGQSYPQHPEEQYRQRWEQRHKHHPEKHADHGTPPAPRFEYKRPESSSLRTHSSKHRKSESKSFGVTNNSEQKKSESSSSGATAHSEPQKSESSSLGTHGSEHKKSKRSNM